MKRFIDYSHLTQFIAAIVIGLTMALPVKAAPFAYITNNGSDTVSVIDTATNTVVDTVAVGANPFGVAVHPDGNTVYVANNQDATVSVHHLRKYPLPVSPIDRHQSQESLEQPVHYVFDCQQKPFRM